MLRPALRHPLIDLLHILPPPHPVKPIHILWILLPKPIHLSELLEQTLADCTPSHERQISIRALIADEPAAAIALQPELDDADDAEDFVDIAVGGALDLLGMEAREPGCLAEIGALACTKKGGLVGGWRWVGG